jgi:hypothetical protein
MPGQQAARRRRVDTGREAHRQAPGIELDRIVIGAVVVAPLARAELGRRSVRRAQGRNAGEEGQGQEAGGQQAVEAGAERNGSPKPGSSPATGAGLHFRYKAASIRGCAAGRHTFSTRCPDVDQDKREIRGLRGACRHGSPRNCWKARGHAASELAQALDPRR